MKDRPVSLDHSEPYLSIFSISFGDLPEEFPFLFALESYRLEDSDELTLSLDRCKALVACRTSPQSYVLRHIGYYQNKTLISSLHRILYKGAL